MMLLLKSCAAEVMLLSQFHAVKLGMLGMLWVQHGSTAAPQHGSTAARQHRSTAAPQHGSTAARQHRSTAAPQHGSTAARQHRSTAAPQHGSTAARQHRSTAAPQHRSTAAPQHRSTAAPQHGSTAAPRHGSTRGPVRWPARSAGTQIAIPGPCRVDLGVDLTHGVSPPAAAMHGAIATQLHAPRRARPCTSGSCTAVHG
eukprot:jgi/Ulvmu1/3931/UM018_0154.1